MKTAVVLGSGQKTVTLSKGILLYTNDQGESLATIHEVENGNLLAGSPLDRNGLDNVVLSLTGSAASSRQLLPERALYVDATTLMWWCPSAIRPIYFKSGKPELDALSGKPVLHPALLFLAQAQKLSVWALAENQRPEGDTPLCIAPYFNIYSSASMCIGNVRLPETLAATTANLAAWEDAFFETNFTHSNYGKPIAAIEGGHNALWARMADCPEGYSGFPKNYLLPLSPVFTVSSALNGKKESQ